MIVNNRDPLAQPINDPLPPKHVDQAIGDAGEATVETVERDPSEPTEAQIVELLQMHQTTAKDYYQQVAQPRIMAAMRALRNEHPTASKYGTPEYRNRTKYHRPKTLQAARKHLTATANALFASADVIKTTPGNEADPVHKANAAMMQELVNFRLDRKNGRRGIPWFLITMGARRDSLTTGYCISKQSWRYKQVVHTTFEREPITEPALEPQIDPATGAPALDEMGQPVMAETQRPVIGPDGQPAMRTIQVDNIEIVEDRPWVELYPIEHVGLDPAAKWEDPAQSSAFVFLDNPTSVAGVMEMIGNENGRSRIRWRRDITEAMIAGAKGTENTSEDRTTRQARTGEADRYEDTSRTTEKLGTSNAIVWARETFFQWQGQEWVVWSIGQQLLLCDPTPLKEAYPEFKGARPITIGTDVIEPHRILPMSHVMAWQPMQQEMNDVVNLRLDTVKQAIAPIAKVVRGKNVDVGAIHRRGPNTVVLVSSKDDVEWDRPPDATAGSFQEMQLLNNDFDDTAGQFAASSVQSNNATGKTVGGMQLIAGQANATSEFDLRVFIESWVEPTLSQLVELEQFYEANETILQLCGERAKLVQKFGVSEITDDLLTSQVMISVNAGIGSSDPQQQMAKFNTALEMTGKAIAGELAQGRVKVKSEPIIDEIFGPAGFKEAAARFFEIVEEDPNAVPPEVQAQQAADEAAKERLKMELDAKIEMKRMELAAEAQLEQMKLRMGVQQEAIGAITGAVGAEREREFKSKQASEDRAFREREGQASREASAQQVALKALAAPAGKPAPGAPAGPAGPSVPQPQPEGPDPQAIVVAIEELGQGQAQLMQGMMAVIKQVRDLAEQMNAALEEANAPVEIVRGEDGRAAGVRKGKREIQINRGEDGRIANLM